MSRNRILYMVVAIALLISAVLIAKSAFATSKVVSAGRGARAAEADAARWVAAGQYYSIPQPSAASFDPQRIRKAESVRWAAMGEAYAGLNQRGSESERAIEADAARWVAAGQHYSIPQPSAASFDPQRSQEAESARWTAMGEAYTGLNERGPESERATRADVARWVALGKNYTAKVSSNAVEQTQIDLSAATRYTGLALREYERAGNTSLLPTCIPANIMAVLPANIGDNHWKSLVPVCSK